MTIRGAVKFLAVALLAAGLFIGRMQLKVSAEFEVAAVENADIRAEVEGSIDEVYLEEGDRVEAGG